jgi:hypothetical protein
MQACGQKVSACNVTNVQLREFSVLTFLIWHRVAAAQGIAEFAFTFHFLLNRVDARYVAIRR